MKASSKEWMLTLHILPLEVSFLCALLVHIFCSTRDNIIPLLLMVGVIVSVFLLVSLPLSPLKSYGPYHVGIRHVAPDLAVFYPTLVKPIEGEPWLPGNDSQYIKNVALQSGLRPLWLKHLRLIRIPCTRNASVVSLMTHTREPRHIFVISHALHAHHLAYSCLALALTARGAIVCSVLHLDSNTSGDFRAGDDTVAGSPSVEQLEKRISEVTLVIRGITSGESLPKLQAGKEEQRAFLSASPKIHLIGHGLGAVTMLAVAMRESSTIASHIGSVTALDAAPLTTLLKVIIAKPTPPQTLPTPMSVQLVDSEEWCNRVDYCLQSEELRQQFISAGAMCVRRTQTGTDHTSITDMGLLTPLSRRRKFAVKKSATFIPIMAKEILQFAESRSDGILNGAIV